MKRLVVTLTILLTIAFVASGQSGRRKPPVASPAPTPETQPVETPKTSEPKAPIVTAEKNQDYRCTEDGTLARLMGDPSSVRAFQLKEVDTPPEILTRPEPKYPEAARHVGIEGTVILKVLLSTNSSIDRVRVVRRLPYGLTENAIRAACGIKFKPAIKDGQPVALWANMEYRFRFSRIVVYGP